MPDRSRPDEVLCLDIGSTWTKGALVAGGCLLGSAQHVTTPPEVMDGVAAVTAELGATAVPRLACSSAGGGLRLAVVGQERLVSAEAGYRAALSAGAMVVHVTAGALDTVAVDGLLAVAPDLLLLCGGTDGGDDEVLLHNARILAQARVTMPVVLAGNAAAASRATDLLAAAGSTVIPAGNVLPDIGQLAPEPARRAIRGVFLRHVIGGQRLSADPRFARLVRSVTPDAVLSAVSRLAGVLAGAGQQGAVLVVDVGGATTDVYSAVAPCGQGGDGGDVHAVGLPADRRTVEGDIGMRFSAPGVIAGAEKAGITPGDRLVAAARLRADDVAFVPADATQADVDAELAAVAATLAIRRHLELIDGSLGPAGAGLLVLSGGVFRHASQPALAGIERSLRADAALRPVLRHARLRVDRRYVLAPAGLLAAGGRAAAADALLREHLDGC